MEVGLDVLVKWCSLPIEYFKFDNIFAKERCRITTCAMLFRTPRVLHRRQITDIQLYFSGQFTGIDVVGKKVQVLRTV